MAGRGRSKDSRFPSALLLAGLLVVGEFVNAVAPNAAAQSHGSSTSQWIQKICNSKKNLPGFVRCTGYDSGITPASASYQPSRVGPLNASREAVNHYAYNDEPFYRVPLHVKGFSTGLIAPDNGVRPPKAKSGFRDAQCAEEATGGQRPRREFPRVDGAGNRIEKGYPLGFRMNDLVAQRFGEGSPLHRWFRDTWNPKHAPKPDAMAADGSCHIWAPWSLDRKVLSSLNSIQGGIMCGDFPLSFGEIKEVYYQLWSEAGGGVHKTSIRTEAFASGTAEQEDFFGSSLVPKTMDANLALAKIGAMGVAYQGAASRHEGIDPSTLLDRFREAVRAGKSVTFDRDHGAEVWNQPAIAIVEVVFKESGRNASGRNNSDEVLNQLPTTEFEAVGTDSGLRELQSIEKNFIVALTQAEGLSPSDRERLEALAGRKLSTGAKPDAALEQQAELMLAAKRKLAREGKIRPRAGEGLRLERREIYLHYGDEIPFAAPVADRTAVRQYDYSAVVGADGKAVHASWNPPRGKLSDLCRQAEPQFMGFTGWNARYECCRLRKGGLDDYPVFTGAVPPRRVTFYDEFKPDLRNPAAEPYFQFRIMLLGDAAFDNEADLQEARRRFGINGQLKPACESFANAEKFGYLFRECREKKKAISDEDLKKLLSYLDQAQFLNAEWVKVNVCSATIPGSAPLIDAARAAGFCR